MQCTNPIRLSKSHISQIRAPDGLVVPCGKCLACRISRRREWTLRMLHEVEYYEYSSFITLTYDDDHIPDNYSLRKRDLTLFIKRIRKALDQKKIRYFSCGEYGSRTHRPHYHSILFGLSPVNADRDLVIKNWPYCKWTRERIRKSFGVAQPNSIQYVAGYIDTKLSGLLAQEEYIDKCREPVFKLSSQGIGLRYCMDNKEKLMNDKCIMFKGKEISLPRYYIQKLGLTPDEMEEVRQKAIDRDCEVVEHYTKLYIDSDTLYKTASDEMKIFESKIKQARKQHNANITAKIGLRQSKL